jgi:murein DD-endopeptidase MepM/ murein hydrolase activator NlpD
VVQSAGWSIGFGNLVVLKHNATYSTAYGHMRGFAKGIHPGVHVRQGDVIGYVGMTGLATGPHLHYEVRVNNVQINPLSVKLMPSQKLEGRDLAAFHAKATSITQRLASLRTNGNKVASN